MSVIKFSKETNSQAIDPNYIKNKEVCMIAVDVVLPAIAAGAAQTIYVHKGGGYINSIISFEPRTALGAKRQEVADKYSTLTCDGKKISISVPTGGTAFVAGDYLNILLLISSEE